MLDHQFAENTVFSLLSKMDKSKFSFHLTGSRFFKVNGLDSDWDFFTESNPETVQFLKDLGFNEISNSYALSNTMVLRHSAGIDVILTPELSIQLTVRNSLRGHSSYLTGSNKSHKKNFWQLCVNLVKSGVDLEKENQKELLLKEFSSS